ncbi:hypothetical protein [Janthinobacterium fluminis]|uniref:Uncharacterized protein n=1 Tax=Janthinobacterium fluminis TaxID=2987524 RepID=A0ABT5K0M8_9BURK|nr:hypothetical protein [Janthinobacterium fluminis]MDC8757856.1 hypothetical protein [Janthinobacterium fluminis]
MRQLPAPLEPWAAWLSLFPPDLAPAVAQLLLRLHPLVGKLSTATLERGAEPAGIGNIVRRGNYERLLMTEWVYADAEPDEFIRRAGSGELLFNGPEPALHQGALRSIALFDAGPAQLGEPRLAHLALFILLARRAEQAGAQFSWGIWHQPGILHDDAGLAGMRKLIKSRTLRVAPADTGQQWEAALGAELADCWLIGAAASDAPRQAGNRVAIRRALSGNHLHVGLQQRRDRRMLQLELPDTPTAVRLLRRPFAPVAPLGVAHHHGSRPSRAQAPRFSNGGNWICVPQLGGGAITYHVPQSAQAKPGKRRIQPAPANGPILAAGLFKHQLSFITTAGGKLRFQGFPGPLFSHRSTVCERPPLEDFQAPPGMARWLQAFYLVSRVHAQPREYVMVLDTKKRLVCWQARKVAPDAMEPEITFRHIADDVIGVQQLNDTLFFACAADNGIQLYNWHSLQPSPKKMMLLKQKGHRLLYGALRSWHQNHSGSLLAIQRSATSWWMGSHNNGETLEIDDGATVLGITRSTKNPNPGLVVVHPGRRRIELRVGHLRYELATAVEEIQQASMDAASARIAWITAKTGTVVVRAIDDDLALLQISCDGGPDEP